MDSMQCCSGLSDLSEFIRKYGTPSFLSGAVELLHWSGLTLVYLHVSANQPRVGQGLSCKEIGDIIIPQRGRQAPNLERALEPEERHENSDDQHCRAYGDQS